MLLFQSMLGVPCCLVIRPQIVLPSCLLSMTDHFYPEVETAVLHALLLTQKACSYYLCKQPVESIRRNYTKHWVLKKEKRQLRSWSSIFEFVIFKAWLHHQCRWAWVWILSCLASLFCQSFFFLIIIGKIVCKIVFCKQEWIGYVEHTLVYILYLAWRLS